MKFTQSKAAVTTLKTTLSTSISGQNYIGPGLMMIPIFSRRIMVMINPSSSSNKPSPTMILTESELSMGPLLLPSGMMPDLKEDRYI
jgi:hypothetical protein